MFNFIRDKVTVDLARVEAVVVDENGKVGLVVYGDAHLKIPTYTLSHYSYDEVVAVVLKRNIKNRRRTILH